MAKKALKKRILKITQKLNGIESNRIEMNRIECSKSIKNKEKIKIKKIFFENGKNSNGNGLGWLIRTKNGNELG